MNEPATRPRITRDTVRYMLTNPTYTGRVSYGDQTQFHPELSLVSEEMFGEVQQRLRAYGRRPLRPKGKKVGHLLTGLLICGRCGGRLDSTHTGKGYRYYRDRNRVRSGSCDQPVINGYDLDSHVGGRVRAVRAALPGDAWDRILGHLDADATRGEARTHKANLRGQLDRLNELYILERIDAPSYEQRVRAISYEMRRCDELINLGHENALQAAIADIRTFPTLIPYDDARQMVDLNNRLRRLFTGIIVDSAADVRIEWSRMALLIFELLGIDPESCARIDGPISPVTPEHVVSSYVQLPLLSRAGAEADDGPAAAPRMPGRKRIARSRPVADDSTWGQQQALFDGQP